jgi:hypothetical protein
VLHGGYDPVIPAQYAELVAESVEGSRLVEVPRVSHGASLSSCGVLVVQQFLEAFAVSDPPPLPACAKESGDVDFALDEPPPSIISQALHQIRFRL